MKKKIKKMRNVTRKELAAAINVQLGITHLDAAEIVDTVFSAMKDSLIADEQVKLVQFGTLHVRHKQERIGRNPRTGETMMITKRRMVSFKPSKGLRERIND